MREQGKSVSDGDRFFPENAYSAFHRGQLIIAKTHVGDCVEVAADEHNTIFLAKPRAYTSVYLNKSSKANHRQVSSYTHILAPM